MLLKVILQRNDVVGRPHCPVWYRCTTALKSFVNMMMRSFILFPNSSKSLTRVPYIAVTSQMTAAGQNHFKTRSESSGIEIKLLGDFDTASLFFCDVLLHHLCSATAANMN